MVRAKLKVSVTIRIDVAKDINLVQLKSLIRDYVKENKFQINDVVFKADYSDEKHIELDEEDEDGDEE